jgi:hypothetical protein
MNLTSFLRFLFQGSFCLLLRECYLFEVCKFIIKTVFWILLWVVRLLLIFIYWERGIKNLRRRGYLFFNRFLWWLKLPNFGWTCPCGFGLVVFRFPHNTSFLGFNIISSFPKDLYCFFMLVFAFFLIIFQFSYIYRWLACTPFIFIRVFISECNIISII